MSKLFIYIIVLSKQSTDSKNKSAWNDSTGKLKLSSSNIFVKDLSIQWFETLQYDISMTLKNQTEWKTCRIEYDNIKFDMIQQK